MLKIFISFIPRIKTQDILNTKGMSIIEVLLSIGTICLFAILVQSMLMLGHSVQQSVRNLFDSLKATRNIQQHMCIANADFINSKLNESKSYKKEIDSLGKRNFKKWGDTPPPSGSIPLLKLYIDGISSEASNFKSSKIGDLINNNPSGYIQGGSNPQYYSVYQDSHTIIKINVDPDNIYSTASNARVNFLSGYIFASRCVDRTDADSIYKEGDKEIATYDVNAVKKSALYILSILERRPYYFPNVSNSAGGEIQCCNDGPTDCKSAKKNWVPRIYIMHLEPCTPSPSLCPTTCTSATPSCSFLGNVVHIQELPELQDMKNIGVLVLCCPWKQGVVLTMPLFNWIQ